jgi:hypothetical protein
MLVCSIHHRSYVPTLKRWYNIEPTLLASMQKLVTITEGTCDECLKTAHISPVTPFPDLFVHESRLPY